MTVKTLKPTTHLIFWGCSVLVLVSVIFLLKSMLLPFVLGIAVAYLLNPAVDKFKSFGLGRKPATIVILSGFIILIAAFLVAVIPLMSHEFGQFANDLPVYMQKLSNLFAPISAMIDKYLGGADEDTLQSLLKQNSASAMNVANIILSNLAAGGQAVFDVLSVAVFMPVVAYFMMVEWPKICAWVQGLIPRHAEGTVMGLLGEINQKLSGFVRGQITVAVVLGIAYALALTLAGLKYGVMIGLSAGILSVIPMVGSAVGLIVSIAVAWFQSGDLSFMAIIAGIFIVGQIIEGNFLTPKLVGDSVGLHPLWVFFALLAGGSLLGILGMFLAVPVAAIIGVLIAFALRQYKKSKYFKNSEDHPQDLIVDEPNEKTAKGRKIL